MADRFVGRQTDITDYRDQLRQIIERSRNLVISNLHAITGMGKTWLAYQIYRQLLTELALPGVWVSFALRPDLPPSPEGERQVDPRRLAESLSGSAVEQLIEASDELVPALLYGPAAAEDPDWEPPESALCEIRWRDAPPGDDRRDPPFLLVIDGLDHLTDEAAGGAQDRWTYVQQQLIKPVADRGRALVICVSQVPLRWGLWELREQAVRRHLTPLSPAETASLVAQHGLQASAALIYDLTRGHPASINYLLEHHRESLGGARAAPEPPPPDRYREIHERIERLDERARQLIEIAGVLRRVEVEAIADLLDRLGFSPPLSKMRLHDALSQYREQGLLIESSEHGPFSFESSLRFVVGYELRQEQPAQFRTICEQLSRWYRERFTERRVTRWPYMVEWAYFSLQLLELSLTEAEPAEGERLIEGWIERFQALWEFGGREEALRQMQSDRDILRLLESLNLEFRRGEATEAGATLIARKAEVEPAQYREELIDYLFQHHFPRPIAEPEIATLRTIAERFGREGFTVSELQARIASSFSPVQWQHLLGKFVGIHAIVRNPSTRKYELDQWLCDFLRGEAGAREEQRR